MAQVVKNFRELTPELQAVAGSKGGTLSKLFQAGYPVPDGFVIFPSAFSADKLTDQAWIEIQAHLNAIRRDHADARFAVRSSALSEDSAHASFAGEFETVLAVKTDEEIHEALYTVFKSKESERVRVYSSVQGIEQSHQIAFVIQRMIESEISGVLFTADPITGSYTHMLGNYVHGLGEQLVAGTADAYSFQLARPKGKYIGPQALKQYASTLYKIGTKLEKELEKPQDIEWAVAKGKLYLLQARPITNLRPGNLDAYEINDSLTEEALWVNTNVAEAVPDVFSPLTWSIIRGFDNELNFIPGYYVWSGNICGRVYSNISRRVSVIATILGRDNERVIKMLADLFGQIPAGMRVPVHPASRFGLLKVMLPRILRLVRSMLKASRNLPRFLKETPDWCNQMSARIKTFQTKHDLLSLWKNELQPYSSKAWWSHAAGGSSVINIMTLGKKLKDLVGTEDANALLSNLRGGAELASLGPLVGISRVVQGEMSRAQYLMHYGHRGPHEFELAIPHPAEDTEWLEQQIEEFKKSGTNVEGLLKRQHTQYEEARKRFQARYPKKAKWLDKQLAKASEGARRRETSRSEFVRVFRIVRAFALRAGELTGIGEDIFFLYIHEVLDLLAGQDSALKHISARKANYEKYKALPPFPSVIRGRFDPVAWAKDPHRRNDYYDPMLPIDAPDSEILKGIAGAAGRIEGRVRVLKSPEEGNLLQVGEILVTTTTNVGWTPIFLKAAAIITDIGAPLSHAAIVARELGIPAVVGCGNATTSLQTGDKVMVDGGQGVVHILAAGSNNVALLHPSPKSCYNPASQA